MAGRPGPKTPTHRKNAADGLVRAHAKRKSKAVEAAEAGEETGAQGSTPSSPEADTPSVPSASAHKTLDHLLHLAPGAAAAPESPAAAMAGLKALKRKYQAVDLAHPPPEVEAAPADPLHPDVEVPEDDPSGRHSSDGDEQRLTRAERRVEALNLRAAGNDYRAIAEHLGVSVKTAYYDVQQALTYLAKYERVLAEDVRAMQLTRLDMLTSYLWPAAEGGDTYAVAQILALMQRQAKLLGLDAPEEVNLNIRRPLKDATLEDLGQLLHKLKEARPVPGAVLSTSPVIEVKAVRAPRSAAAAADGDDDDDDNGDDDADNSEHGD